MSDEIKRLVDHFNSFIATSNTNKTFSAQEFVAYMEPVFAQCGYREKPAPDKQLKILILSRRQLTDSEQIILLWVLMQRMDLLLLKAGKS